MQVNSRALLWGGAISVIVIVIALMVLPFVYVALALAVLLLIALVVANRMRQASDADREAANDESSARLGTLSDDPDFDPDYEPYDASTFDSVVFRPEQTRDTESPPYADEAPEQFEEFTEPEAEWTADDIGGRPSYGVDDRLGGNGLEANRVNESRSLFEVAEYTSDFEGPPATEERIERTFEEYTGPSRDGARHEYESTLAEESADQTFIDDLDASLVLADEGVIDESKVTTAETILAASQVSRFEPETMSDEESNEETREILGRVAALLAKYE